jgi:sterol desaturase/sphingolipid hydroxylase (fatty acid hydroxylase superfamily)
MLSQLNAGDSILLLLLRGFASQVVSYFLMVGLVFLLIWKLGNKFFAKNRIPNPARMNRKQLLRELAYTVVTFAAGMFSGGAVMFLYTTGRTALVPSSGAWWHTPLWLISLLAFNDAWFYGIHRQLHRPLLFRHVHSVHHKSIDVNPFSSYAFHAVESILLGAWVLPASLVLPIPVSVIGILQVFGLANNVMSHLGYELLPKWIIKVPLLRWTNTATFHSLHHTKVNGNFGLHTRLWDRLFGTEVANYEEAFVKRGE